MDSRGSIFIVVFATIALLGSCTSPGTGEAPGIPTALPFSGLRAVGPLFPPGSATHTCTASVVDSPSRNLLITAAHCISGKAIGFVFAPSYHDGAEPLGSWTVVAAYGDPLWIDHRDEQNDFAFLVVAPHRMDGHLVEIQDLTGAYSVVTAPLAGAVVTVPAYAGGIQRSSGDMQPAASTTTAPFPPSIAIPTRAGPAGHRGCCPGAVAGWLPA